MKHILIFLSIILYSCSSTVNSNDDCESYNEIMRQAIVNEGYATMFGYQIDENGTEYLGTQSFYNDRGDLIEMSFSSGMDQEKKEKYTYDDKYRISEIQSSVNGQSWTLQTRNEYNDANNQEVNTFYAEDGRVYRTEYRNNDQGKNISNRYYIDGVLTFYHQFYWSNSCNLDSVVRFDADSNRTGDLSIMSYSKERLASKVQYSNGRATEIEKFEYNEIGLQTSVILEVPGEYRHSTTITYKDNLPFTETMVYKSLQGAYEESTLIKWKYAKK